MLRLYFANCKSVERAASTAYIQLILVKELAVRILDVCRGTLQGCSLTKERSQIASSGNRQVAPAPNSYFLSADGLCLYAIVLSLRLLVYSMM